MVKSHGFPVKNPLNQSNHLWFSYGFPMVFLWFSYGFPIFAMVFLLFSYFCYGFPMVFPSQKTATAPRDATATPPLRAFNVATAARAHSQGVATPKAALRRTTPLGAMGAMWLEPTEMVNNG